jgi:hypothetical protein
MTLGSEILSAQSPSPYYYCIERLSDGFIVRRGATTSAGIPQNGLILAPNTEYRFWLLEANTGLVGYEEFPTPSSGLRFTIPNIGLTPSLGPDTDGDGLADDAEFTAGTDPEKVDTDEDGIRDFAEMKQGLDPLDGLNVRIGILGGTDTPGNATDVCAINDIAVVADSGSGVTVFNIFNRMSPLIIAQVSVPGTALRVSCSGNLIGVAAGAGGLAVIDVATPPDVRIVKQVSLGGSAQAIASDGGIAYVGTSSGDLVAVEMLSGAILQRLRMDGPVQDVGLGDGTLYVLTRTSFYAVALDGEELEIARQVPFAGFIGTGARPFRLFVAGDLAYANDTRAIFIFDLTNPRNPTLRQQNLTTQLGWKQLVPNGAGLGLAVVGPNGSDGGADDVSLYDLGPSGLNLAFVTTYVTPGVARALSIYNGIAYVADGTAGLQVLNYLAYDNGTNPPTISLTANFGLAPAQVEGGKNVRVSAVVTDDVQVRNVEFYVDSQRIVTDGNHPFEVHCGASCRPRFFSVARS